MRYQVAAREWEVQDKLTTKLYKFKVRFLKVSNNKRILENIKNKVENIFGFIRYPK